MGNGKFTYGMIDGYSAEWFRSPCNVLAKVSELIDPDQKLWRMD